MVKSSRFKTGGKRIPQSAIFDLETRSIKKRDLGHDTLSEELPRLWVRQISNFIVAYHKAGTFEDIRVRDVSEDVRQWQEDEQPALRRYAALLKLLISLARSSEDSTLELSREEGSSELHLRKPCGEAQPCLPQDLQAKWTVDDSGVNGPNEGHQSDDEFFSCPDVESPDDDLESLGYWDDEESDLDYTACSASDCGYCGHCKY